MISAFPILQLHWLGISSFDSVAPPFFKPLHRNDKLKAICSNYTNFLGITRSFLFIPNLPFEFQGKNMVRTS